MSGSQTVWALVEQDPLRDFRDKIQCMSLEGLPEAQRVEHEHCVFLQCVSVVFLDLLWFAGAGHEASPALSIGDGKACWLGCTAAF